MKITINDQFNKWLKEEKFYKYKMCNLNMVINDTYLKVFIILYNMYKMLNNVLNIIYL